jgi:hypothetical protein
MFATFSMEASRKLRDDDGVLEPGRQHHLPRLAVAQQPRRVRERRPERDGARLVVEVRGDGLDGAGVLVRLAVRHHQLHRPAPAVARPTHQVEVLRLGDVEVHPHRRVVRERRQQVALVDEAALPRVEAAHDARERRANLGEPPVRGRQVQLRLRSRQVRLRQRQLVRRDDVLVGEHAGVVQLDLRPLGLGLGLLHLGLRQHRHQLEHLLALLEPLALVDEDALQGPVLERPHLDVLHRAQLAHVLRGQVDGPSQRRGGRHLDGLLGRRLGVTTPRQQRQPRQHAHLRSSSRLALDRHGPGRFQAPCQRRPDGPDPALGVRTPRVCRIDTPRRQEAIS